MRPDQLITARQAAELKGVQRMSVYRAIKTGKLPAVRIDGIWLVRRDQLDRWTVVGHRPRRPEGVSCVTPDAAPPAGPAGTDPSGPARKRGRPRRPSPETADPGA